MDVVIKDENATHSEVFNVKIPEGILAIKEEPVEESENVVPVVTFGAVHDYYNLDPIKKEEEETEDILDIKSTTLENLEEYETRTELTFIQEVSKRLKETPLCTNCVKRFPSQSSFLAHVCAGDRLRGLKSQYMLLLARGKLNQFQERQKEFALKNKAELQQIRNSSYNCEECNRKFTYKSQLQIHMRIHNGRKPYKCHECSKDFSQMTSLKNHSWLHEPYSAWPYQCIKCRKRFVQKHTLTIHLGTHRNK